MPKQPGRTLHEKCPSCRKGVLQAVMRAESERSFGLDTPIGTRLPAREEVIERLACSNCSASFEAAQRGMTTKSILKPQIEGFVKKPQPGTVKQKSQPKACPHCDGKLARATFDPHESLRVGGPLLSQHDQHSLDSQVYLYCDGCLVVAWVKPKYRLPAKLAKDIRKAVAKAATERNLDQH